MADRPNNFGEVLFKALGNTAKEAPSIFDNAATRKKAEALHLFDAMLKLQDAEREKQQLTMAQQQQETQMKTAALNQQLLLAKINQTAMEMSEPYRESVRRWEKEKADADSQRRINEAVQIAKRLASENIDRSGRSTVGGSGAPGSFYLTPDDLVRRGQSAQGDKLSAIDKQIQAVQFFPSKADELAKLRLEREQIASPKWLAASLSAPTDSLGIPSGMISPLAMPSPPSVDNNPDAKLSDEELGTKYVKGWSGLTGDQKKSAIPNLKKKLGLL